MEKMTWDLPKMKNAVTQIEEQISKYENARKAIEDIVGSMNGYVQSPTSTSFIAKYNSNLKNDALSVENAMKSYRNFLNETIRAIEKFEKKHLVD